MTDPAAGAAVHPTALAGRLEAIGREIGAREKEHQDGLAQARACAEGLHRRVADALEAFHAAAGKAGAAHLQISLGTPRIDDKHLRSVQFEVRRGRTAAIVTVKSRGDVTLVGPFHTGKTEGPCKTFPLDAHDEIETALGAFLESFVEEAATP